MSKEVYVCSTYYHVLISILKILNSKERSDIVITHYIPDNESLYKKIFSVNIFENVYIVPQINEYIPNNIISKLFFLHKKNKKMILEQIEIQLYKYEKVYIFHDDTWVAHYLKEMKKSYYLIEDAYNSFQTIKDSKFYYMVDVSFWKKTIKKILNYGYLYGCDSKYVLSIEVNNINNLQIPLDKVFESPRDELFDNLSLEDIKIIHDVFFGDVNNNLFRDEETRILLLTQPLFQDGFVETEAMQLKLYEKILKEYSSIKDTIYIKPHPRDNANYESRFKNANILNKNIPIEAWHICYPELYFYKGITIDSTALSYIRNVGQKVYLGKEYMNESIEKA